MPNKYEPAAIVNLWHESHELCIVIRFRLNYIVALIATVVLPFFAMAPRFEFELAFVQGKPRNEDLDFAHRRHFDVTPGEDVAPNVGALVTDNRLPPHKTWWQRVLPSEERSVKARADSLKVLSRISNMTGWHFDRVSRPSSLGVPPGLFHSVWIGRVGIVKDMLVVVRHVKPVTVHAILARPTGERLRLQIFRDPARTVLIASHALPADEVNEAIMFRDLVDGCYAHLNLYSEHPLTVKFYGKFLDRRVNMVAITSPIVDAESMKLANTEFDGILIPPPRYPAWAAEYSAPVSKRARIA